VLSLPIFPELSDAQQQRVIEVLLQLTARAAEQPAAAHLAA
jgi:dTDP-4-amino-4,6-dideoxygalactose transaminase